MKWSAVENIAILYRLMQVKGIGNVQTNKILSSLDRINKAKELEQALYAVLDASQRECFRDAVLDNDEVNCNWNYLSVMDENYPSDLKNFLGYNTPPVLSYMGNLDLLKKKRIGISGSRKVSEKGIRITRDCVEQLVKNDCCIVSGYAAGVDEIAHLTALDNDGTTIIVLPEGMTSFKVKKDYQSVWDWNRVLIISQFFPKDKWMVSRAMLRNQTIIGLSDAMIVVEAGDKGGSLDAGMKSIQQGKLLFVPQYEQAPPSAIGNNLLIEKGALPIRMKRETRRANLQALYENIHNRKSKKYITDFSNSLFAASVHEDALSYGKK